MGEAVQMRNPRRRDHGSDEHDPPAAAASRNLRPVGPTNAPAADDAAAAMRRLKAGRVRRKLVITMTPAG
jgi:hypothetical protein